MPDLSALCLLAFVFLASSGVCESSSAQERLPAASSWFLASSAKVGGSGEVISTSAYKIDGWVPVTVPSTVVGALCEANIYKDPNFGINLRKIPGTTYKIGENFSNKDMPEDSPFRVGWWYRETFQPPFFHQGDHVWLHLDGLNYSADIWMNGRRVAGRDVIAGTFRSFDLDVTSFLVPNGGNVLAIEVYAPQKNDLALTWVDWNPMPADKNMGLWRGVSFHRTGPVRIVRAHAIPHLKLPGLESATVDVDVTLANTQDVAARGEIQLILDGRVINQTVDLPPQKETTITVNASTHAGLRFEKPRVWWPHHLGEQNLYGLDVIFAQGKLISDKLHTKFGIRDAASTLTPEGARLFKINGKSILIRGGGWAQDMLLRNDSKKLEAQIRYVVDLGLNTIRLEGKFETDEFYDLADRYGILLIEGWSCCDHWENWPAWKPGDQAIAAESLRSRVRALENHPSMLAWLNGSDILPPVEIEKMYLQVLGDEKWEAAVVSSAGESESTVTGPSGVKMTGPYSYVPPVFWSQDKHAGGAWGFNTETSPGPAIPPIDTLKTFLPANHMKPDKWWTFHAGGTVFADLSLWFSSLKTRFGKSRTIDDLAYKSQILAYETHRAMFEAYARNKYTSTGVVQWMLNNGWPSMIWHLYDFYLRPGGSYFGAKKANEMLHIMYSYDDQTIDVVNHTYVAKTDLVAKIKVFDLKMKPLCSVEKTLTVDTDGVVHLMKLPEISGLSRTYFLDLTLVDARGTVASRNFYWLSTKPDIPGPRIGDSILYGPTLQDADFKLLHQLPMVKLNLATVPCITNTRGAAVLPALCVTLENPSSALAFFIHLKVNDEKGREILPVTWEDNYFSLLPGERRTLKATFIGENIAKDRVATVEGYNVAN